MTIKHFLSVCLILTASIFQNSFAQDNPGNPFFASYPVSGTWFAMDNSNTGFFMSVQNGILAGAYFGFDGDGQNVWLLFSGALQPLFSTEAPLLQTGWRLETDLRQAANGGCIVDCNVDNNEPHSTFLQGPIVLEFTGRSSAVVTVNNSSMAIVPFYFGIQGFTAIRDTFTPPPTPGRIILTQPDLEGTWAVAIGNTTLDSEGNLLTSALAESAGIIEIGPQEQFLPGPIGIPPAISLIVSSEAAILRDTTGIFNEDSSLDCAFFDDFRGGEVQLLAFCEVLEFNSDFFMQDQPVMLRGNMQLVSGSRFIMHVEPVDGTLPEQQNTITRLEFFRIGHN